MPSIRRILASTLMVAFAPTLAAAETPPPPETDLPVVFQADFDHGGFNFWKFTDKDAWRLTDRDGGKALELHKASKYEPKVRSPFNIALPISPEVGDFVLDVDARSTGRDYGHRDLCFIFGHQDPSHFYYVHLAKAADPHANSIFLVNDEPRVTIAETRTDGTNWDDEWHHVRIERKVADGTIRVFFDDMTKPVMTTHDKTFAHGRIGLGSFDDTGLFDNLVVRGQLLLSGPE